VRRKWERHTMRLLRRLTLLAMTNRLRNTIKASVGDISTIPRLFKNAVAHPSVVSSIFEGLGQSCLILPLKDRQLQRLKWGSKSSLPRRVFDLAEGILPRRVFDLEGEGAGLITLTLRQAQDRPSPSPLKGEGIKKVVSPFDRLRTGLLNRSW